MRDRLQFLRSQLVAVPGYTVRGKLLEVRGQTLRAVIPGIALGELVTVERQSGCRELHAQVVGFSDGVVVLTPFEELRGVFPGAEVRRVVRDSLKLSPQLLGCVVDGLGRVIFCDGPEPEEEGGPTIAPRSFGANSDPTLVQPPPDALVRAPISEVLCTGIRAIDGLVTLGRGQRLGIFAEPGVGKSTLVGCIARNTAADINVIGLIGERGREVHELLFDTLDSATRRRTVAVVSTGDEAAIRRVSAALVATRIAEYFRDLGYDVLLQLDSLTRLVRALREVGLAAGEPPVRRGYPPSVFAELPRIIERAGTGVRGSITALYTVLLSSDLDEDPMVEEIKGLTDGHLVLRQVLAERGHYPAIDVCSSISRLASRLLSARDHAAAGTVRAAVARLNRDRDLAVLSPSPDPQLQALLRLEPQLEEFLRQRADETADFAGTLAKLRELAALLEDTSGANIDGAALRSGGVAQ